MTAKGDPSQRLAVRCRGLIKRYGDLTAVDGADLSVRRGEVFGLLGPNGAGKTTTVEILEGLTSPDGGEVEVLGQRWGRGSDRRLRERIGVQLQQTQLADKLTVEETITLFRSFYRGGRSTEEVLELVGLTSKRRSRVHKLSGGQNQRLALACALVGDPDLLFLDEPTTGLDPQARRRIWEVVEAFRRNGGSVVLTTHYMEEADRLCDRVAIIDRGKVIAEGTPAELVDALGAEQVLELTVGGDLALDELESLPGVVRASSHGEVYRLALDEVGAALPALLARLEERAVGLETLSTKRPSLEDVFVSFTGRGLRDG